MIQMVQQQIIPSCFTYQTEIADSLTKATSLLSQFGSKKDSNFFKPQIDYFENISSLLSKLLEASNVLQVELSKEQELSSFDEKAEFYVTVLLPLSLKVCFIFFKFVILIRFLKDYFILFIFA